MNFKNILTFGVHFLIGYGTAVIINIIFQPADNVLHIKGYLICLLNAFCCKTIAFFYF